MTWRWNYAACFISTIPSFTLLCSCLLWGKQFKCVMPSPFISKHHFRFTFAAGGLNFSFCIGDSTYQLPTVGAVPRYDFPIILLLQHSNHFLYIGIENWSEFAVQGIVSEVSSHLIFDLFALVLAKSDAFPLCIIFYRGCVFCRKMSEVKNSLFIKRKTERNECIEYPYSTDSFTPGTRLSLAVISRVLSRSQWTVEL